MVRKPFVAYSTAQPAGDTLSRIECSLSRNNSIDVDEGSPPLQEISIVESHPHISANLEIRGIASRMLVSNKGEECLLIKFPGTWPADSATTVVPTIIRFRGQLQKCCRTVHRA